MRPAMFLGLFAFAALPLRAQISAASCTCNPKAGTLLIRYTPDLSEEKPAWPADPKPVEFMSLLVLDKPGGTNVEDTTSKTITCRLSKDRFDITLEPAAPNVNLLGRCGAEVTGLVTVERNGTVVIDHEPFETIDCGARKRYLSKITFRDRSAKPSLKYVKYREP